MSYIARDIELNSNGRFTFTAGVDNVGQKIEKLFAPLLAQFIGQKTAVPLGNVLGSVRLIGIIKDIYLESQDSAINREVYDIDDTVTGIDTITVKQINPTTVEFSFRVVMPDSSIQISGSIPVGQGPIGLTG